MCDAKTQLIINNMLSITMLWKEVFLFVGMLIDKNQDIHKYEAYDVFFLLNDLLTLLTTNMHNEDISI